MARGVRNLRERRTVLSSNGDFGVLRLRCKNQAISRRLLLHERFIKPTGILEVGNCRIRNTQ